MLEKRGVKGTRGRYLVHWARARIRPISLYSGNLQFASARRVRVPHRNQKRYGFLPVARPFATKCFPQNERSLPAGGLLRMDGVIARPVVATTDVCGKAGADANHPKLGIFTNCQHAIGTVRQ